MRVEGQRVEGQKVEVEGVDQFLSRRDSSQ